MCIIGKCKLSLYWKRPGQKDEQHTWVDRDMVKQAGEELKHAYHVLSNVEDHEMVDYAVFTLQAAEKRYDYLLKKLKEEEKQKESLVLKKENANIKSLNC